MKTLALTIAALSLSFFAAGHGSRADVPDQPAAPNAAIVILVGERIELTLKPGEAVREVSRGPASPSDEAALPQMPDTAEAVKVVGVAHAPKPDRLVASLWSDGAGTRLEVENGYAFPVIYRAFLVFEHNGQRTYRPTSICPVLPGRMGLEGWGDHVVGIAVTGFEVLSPDHMACNDGSILTVAPTSLTADQYVCDGGERPRELSPLTVAVTADGAGAIREVHARWTLSTPDLIHAPALFFDYPLEGRNPPRAPIGLSVLALASLKPPPTATAAEIVLRLNGVEKIRRPWQMYAKGVQQPPSSDPNKQPVFFSGVIPFYPRPGDDGLVALLHGVGEPGAAVEVQVVGNDGSIIADATYKVDQPAVRSQSDLDAALDEALAKAKTPTQCQKVSN